MSKFSKPEHDHASETKLLKNRAGPKERCDRGKVESRYAKVGIELDMRMENKRLKEALN